MNREILWLPSWYPDKLKPFEGDFIQRHAQAAALYNKIYIIKVVPDEKGLVTKSLKTEINNQHNLTEEIIYFGKSPSFLGRIIANFKRKKIYRMAIREYIKQNGKPFLVHIHVVTLASMPAVWLNRKFNIPFLISEHWTIYQPKSSGEFVKRNFLFKNVVKKIVKRSLVLLTVSNDLGKQLQKLVYFKKYIVVSNVVNESFFNYKPFSSATFRFVHISTMCYQKNVEAIIENFVIVRKNFPNVELILVGPADEKLIKAAENTGLLNQSVFFRGEIPYQQVANELHQSNVLVLFSHFENQPCVIIESLCCGIPVISSSVGGIPEIVNNTNGILVNSNVRHSLADAMQKIINEYNFFDQKKISEKALAMFNYSTIGKKFDEIYSSVSD